MINIVVAGMHGRRDNRDAQTGEDHNNNPFSILMFDLDEGVVVVL